MSVKKGGVFIQSPAGQVRTLARRDTCYVSMHFMMWTLSALLPCILSIPLLVWRSSRYLRLHFITSLIWYGVPLFPLTLPPSLPPLLTHYSLPFLYSIRFIHLNFLPLAKSARLIKIDSDRIEKWARLEMKVENFLDVRVRILLAPHTISIHRVASLRFGVDWFWYRALLPRTETETEKSSPSFLPSFLPNIPFSLSWFCPNSILDQ